jgi:hypothetical protein
MNLRVAFQAAICVGALLAIIGGGAIGICTMIDPGMEILGRLEHGYRHIIVGFGVLAAFAVASSLIDALSRVGRGTPAPAPEAPAAPAPVPTPPSPAAVPAPPKSDPTKLEALYHEMKTYIDLEMWELALEKATLIVEKHAGTKEADLVSRNLNELRWKAEPKFVSAHPPITADQEKQMREKGLAAMYNHVKTYMDLDMWELARQKAVAIMKSFPDSPESAELMKVYETIERRAREAAAARPVAEQAGR